MSEYPVAWLLVACAILAWPGHRRATAPQTDATDPVEDTAAQAHAAGRADEASRIRRRDRVVTVAAVIALAVLCVGLVGPKVGLPAAAIGCPLAVVALDRARRRAAANKTADRSVALALDLAAAALRSGRPVPDALALAAPAASPEVARSLVRTARLLELGAEPAEAWGVPDGSAAGLAAVAEIAVRSHASGVRLADAFERAAHQVRADCRSRALARAQRAGVQAMGPLAACFLPSFVCLGIVPVIAGVASTVLRTVS